MGFNLTCSGQFNTVVKTCPCNIGFRIKACVHKCSNQWRMCTNGKYFEWIFLFNCHTSLAVTLMLSLIRDTTHGLTLLFSSPRTFAWTGQISSKLLGLGGSGSILVYKILSGLPQQKYRVKAKDSSKMSSQFKLSMIGWCALFSWFQMIICHLSDTLDLILSHHWFQFKSWVTSVWAHALKAQNYKFQ